MTLKDNTDIKVILEYFKKHGVTELPLPFRITKDMKRQEVYKAIDSERDHQDKTSQWDEGDSVAQFLLSIEATLSMAKAEHYHNHKYHVMEEMRKIAALAVRFGEVHGYPARIPDPTLGDVGPVQ